MKKLRHSFYVIIPLLLAACGKIGYSVEKVDETHTTLYLGNYDGGAGHVWLDKLIEEFEELHKDDVLEEGKKGVKISVKNDKDKYLGNNLFNDISSNIEDIYVSGSISYADFAAAGKIADITDIITELDEDGSSVESRLYDSMRRQFKLNNHYYGVPTISAMSGIVYDVDLFEDEQLFISNSSTEEKLNWTGKDNKSLGMDGVANTYDDGLPETFEQFKKLMTRMTQKSITPLTWSGMYQTYRQRFMNYIWASYEGSSDYMLNYTFNGTDSDSGEIDYSNGYLLQKQMGKKAAIYVAKYIISHSELYSENAIKTSQSHTQAQTEFLTSVEKDKRIAMILEGSWWENEARGTFDSMVKYSSEYAYGTRRFGYMPFPRFVGTEEIPDSTSTKNAVLCDAGSGCFIINSKSNNIPLAKEFLKFILSKKSMAHFTATNGVTLPYEYELSAEQYNGLTPYARSLWDVIHDENTEIVYPSIDNILRVENSTFFSGWEWGSKVRANGVVQNVYEPMMSFYSYPELTVEDYFNGLSDNYSKEKWEGTLSKYFN